MKVKIIQLQKKHCVQSQIAESTMGSIFYKVQKIISYTKKSTNNVQNHFHRWQIYKMSMIEKSFILIIAQFLIYYHISMSYCKGNFKFENLTYFNLQSSFLFLRKGPFQY